MELKQLRQEIDKIDGQMTELLAQRMELSARIAHYKVEHKLPVYDPQLERQKRADMAEKAGNALAPATDALFSLLFDLSRSYQNQITAGETSVKAAIRHALEKTDKIFPTRPIVACQGVEGAFSQQACERIFSSPSIMYFDSFEGVFAAIEQGLCRYGVLPLENSTAGSVNRIYDLMMKHNFFIVRSSRVKVDHCLLANKTTKISDIREIYSHEQAISQCTDMLKNFANVRVIPCENTAVAAKMIFESGRTDAAALSSRNCAEIYGLDCLLESVQDQGNNYTRFICISRQLEIYPGANRSSLMLVLPNRQGSLYRALSRFNALGINLLKLESRPLPNSDFEFMFYFDLEMSAQSDVFLRMFDDLGGLSTNIKYLGTYSEVI
jgi:chorismate mutase/prephenate dehydratase